MTTQVNTYEKNMKSAKIGTLAVDKIKLGRGWQKFVPTLTNHTANAGATKTWKYLIEGTTLHVTGYYFHTASGSVTANSVYYWSYPTGCTVATADLGYACGSAYIIGGTTQKNGVVVPSTSSVCVQLPIDATTAAFYGLDTTTPADIRFSVNGNLVVGIKYSVELDPTCAALSGNPVP